MVHSCCIKNCKSQWNPYSSITYHSFPRNLKDVWITNIPVDLRPKSVTPNSRICSKHFTPESFRCVQSFRNCLLKTAIPTIFYDINVNNDTNKDIDDDTNSELLVVSPRLPLSVVEDEQSEQYELIEDDEPNLNTGIKNTIFICDVAVQTEPITNENDKVVSKNSIGVQTYFKSNKRSLEEIAAENKNLKKKIKRRNDRINYLENKLKETGCNKNDGIKLDSSQPMSDHMYYKLKKKLIKKI